MKARDEAVRRHEAVHRAIASARIEGQGPTPETQAILDEFVAGQIDAAELMRRLLDQR